MDWEKLAPGDFSFGDEDDGAETSPGSIRGHGGGGVAGGGAGDPLEAALHRDGQCGGHAGVFEGTRGIHALVLGQDPVDAEGVGGAGQIIEGSVAFAQGGDLLEVADDRKEIAEPPDSGLVDGLGRGATFLPEPTEGRGVRQVLGGCRSVAPRIDDFEERPADCTAEIRRNLVAVDAGGAADAS